MKKRQKKNKRNYKQTKLRTFKNKKFLKCKKKLCNKRQKNKNYLQYKIFKKSKNKKSMKIK